MNSTLIRVFSALVAVGILGAIYYYFEIVGLMAITLLVGVGVATEFMKLMFYPPAASRALSMAFLMACMGVMGVALLPHMWAAAALSIGIVFTLVIMMVTMREFSVEQLFTVSNRLFMGILYCGFFPTLIIWILRGPNGTLWFLTLLLVVFANDTFAYFSGRALGKNKMWEKVSPKKTWIGSAGGLFGSVCAVVVMKVYWLTGVEWPLMLAVGFLGGILGQAGDMFESLLKRVAGVKDSGTIMPGHGGFMDRVDSVLFACPVFFLAAQISS